MRGIFKTKIIDLGDVYVGKKYIVIFNVIKKLPPIYSIVSSCGCSKPSYNESKKQIVVNYTPNKIPNHLREQGWYETTKSITVKYRDGSEDILRFKSTVKK